MKSDASLSVSDIARLYELALTTGASLDLETCCDSFVRSLATRQSMDYVSVWLRETFLGDDIETGDDTSSRERNAWRLISATPRHHVDAALGANIRSPEEIRVRAGGEPVLLEPIDPSNRGPESATSGYLAHFTLGDFGIVRILTTERRLTETDCFKLKRLMERFSIAVEACVSHAGAVRANARRKAVIRELRETTELLDTLSDHLNSGVMMEDEGGRCLRTNATFRSMFGLSHEIEDGDRTNSRIAPSFADQGSFKSASESAQKAEEAVTLGDFTLADGRVVEVEYSPVAVAGELVAHMWQYRDVTDSVVSRRTIEASDRRQRLLLANALDAVITIDQHGDVLDWNPQAQTIFGFTREEAVGERMSTMIVPDQYREPHEKGLENYRKTGEGPVLNQRFEIEAQHKDGSVFPIELTIHPVVTDESTTFTAFARDISERKLLERMKDDLVATVSHELRTPLTSLQGFVEILRNRDVDSETRNRYLDVIFGESQRLKRLLDDLLDVQRLESGQVDYSFSYVLVGSLLREMVEVFRAQEERMEIALNLPEEDLSIHADGDRIRQVVANLLSNAIKFSGDSSQVNVGLRSEENHAVLSFRDRGIGIAPEDRAQIFEKFYRTQDALGKAIGGSGLGLPLVQRIVEDHGGRVVLDSCVGKGSTFEVHLPLAEEASSQD